jgi:hypothetical protein
VAEAKSLPHPLDTHRRPGYLLPRNCPFIALEQMMKRKINLLVAIVALALTAIGLAPSAAHAATATAGNPYALCGLGFTIAKQERVVRFDDPAPVATFYLMYNRLTDSFCGVTIKTRYVGTSTETMAAVRGAAQTMVINSGPRFYVAGPVFDRPGDFGSLGRCVLYGASLTDPKGKQYFHETANPAIGWSLYCLP